MEEVAEWYQLGVQLGVPTGKLKEIERNYLADNQRCKTEVLTWWCQNIQVSWIKLAQAVERTGYKVLAEKLRNRTEKG